MRPVATTTVVHLSGSLGLDALAPAPAAGRPAPAGPAAQRRGRRGPAALGRHLRRGRRAGRPGDIAEALGGRLVEVADDDRAAYHAAACIAANHVVALLGQVERVAASVGLDLESFLPLTRAAVDDVAALGAAAALTGPARRGDWATLSRHLDALPEGERPGYQAGAALATRLAAAPPCRRRPQRPLGRWTSSRPRAACRALLDRGPGRRPLRRPRAHHGRAARGAPLAHGAGPGRVRRGGREHLRQPAAVRRPRRHRQLPAHPRADLPVCAEAGADVVFVPLGGRDVPLLARAAGDHRVGGRA